MSSRILPALLLGLVISIGVARATPPDSIGLSFDSTSTLAVYVHHPVKNVTAHYIKEIVVQLNGAPIITQEFKTQTDLDWQVVSYTVIDARPGDKISVTATCVLYGQLTQTLTIQ